MKQELIAACRQARNEMESRESHVPQEVLMSNGWIVRVETVHIRPSGGACRAWKFLYYLIAPNVAPTAVKKFGGYDTQSSFVSWAERFMAKR